MPNTPIKGGYILKARKHWKSRIAAAPPATREVWDWLLTHANSEEATYSGYTVKRGQLFTSYSKIQQGLAWKVGFRKKTYTTSHIRTAMKNLRSYLMISTHQELSGILVNIEKYDFYQDYRNYKKDTIRTTESRDGRNHNNIHVSGNTIIKDVDNSPEKAILEQEVAKVSHLFRIEPVDKYGDNV